MCGAGARVSTASQKEKTAHDSAMRLVAQLPTSQPLHLDPQLTVVSSDPMLSTYPRTQSVHLTRFFILSVRVCRPREEPVPPVLTSAVSNMDPKSCSSSSKCGGGEELLLIS